MNWTEGGSNSGHGAVPGGDLMMQMGMQYTQRLLSDSERNVSRWLPIAELKKRFRVSHKYVLGKLQMIALPYTKNFERRQYDFDDNFRSDRSGAVEFFPPVDDVCAPDLYIPLMAVVTYITLYAFVIGLRGDVASLDPQDLAATATFTVVSLAVEVVFIKMWRYVVGLVTISMLDLLGVVGYAFVPISLTVLLGMLGLSAYPWPFRALTFFLGLNFVGFLFKSLRELFAKDGVVPKRALPILYGCCAAQLPLFFVAVARPFL